MSSFSLVDLGNLSEVAKTLIEKVSSAIWCGYEPVHIERVAKAEARADLIKAAGKIKEGRLQERAIHRLIEEEARRQENMEGITKKALPFLNENSDANAMDDDWVTNFFNKSRNISDEEMQTLWSKILAGEANKPGSFSKRTVNCLNDLDKTDAEIFQALCRFGWWVGTFTILIFDVSNKIYKDHRLYFNALTHLESIGLIKLSDGLTKFGRTRLPKSFTVSYCGKPLSLTMQKDKDNELNIGDVMLTKVGQELASVCHAEGVDGFYEFVKEMWKEHIPASS